MSETSTSDMSPTGFDGLEYVQAEPPMIRASAIGSFDGKCAVDYHGAAGRCTGEPEYKTAIAWRGDREYIALCSKHADAREDAYSGGGQ